MTGCEANVAYVGVFAVGKGTMFVLIVSSADLVVFRDVGCLATVVVVSGP